MTALNRLQKYRHLFGRFRQVRYEAMLGDPLGAVAELFAWVGLEHDGDVLTAVKQRSKLEFARFDAMDPVGPGKWTQLRERDRAEILTVAGDWLTDLGYIDEVSG